MTAAIFLIALMGCGEGEAPCQQIRVLETRYVSQAACTAATEAVLARNLGGDYPVIVAQCRRAGAASIIRPREVKLPAPERTPLFGS
jgi:hypothetical protein